MVEISSVDGMSVITGRKSVNWSIYWGFCDRVNDIFVVGSQSNISFKCNVGDEKRRKTCVSGPPNGYTIASTWGSRDQTIVKRVFSVPLWLQYSLNVVQKVPKVSGITSPPLLGRLPKKVGAALPPPAAGYEGACG